MAENLRYKIVELLSRDISKLFSISEISKNLKSAYSHCNKYVNELSREGVLRLVKIANAHIVVLNLKSNLTLAYLTMVEYQKLKEFSSKSKAKTAKINLFISRVKKNNLDIDTIFVKNNQLFIVVRNIMKDIMEQVSDEKPGINYVIIDRAEFQKNQTKYIGNHYIYYGAERFWDITKKKVNIEVYVWIKYRVTK